MTAYKQHNFFSVFHSSRTKSAMHREKENWVRVEEATHKTETENRDATNDLPPCYNQLLLSSSESWNSIIGLWKIEIHSIG